MNDTVLSAYTQIHVKLPYLSDLHDSGLTASTTIMVEEAVSLLPYTNPQAIITRASCDEIRHSSRCRIHQRASASAAVAVAVTNNKRYTTTNGNTTFHCCTLNENSIFITVNSLFISTISAAAAALK